MNVTTTAANGFNNLYDTPIALDANGDFTIINPDWNEGTYTITLACTDEAGNGPTVLGPFGPVTVDFTNPTVTIDQAIGQDDPTNIDSATYTVVFSEAIDPATFDATDIEITGTTTASITTGPTTTDNITWTFIVTGMTDGDTITATIDQDMVTDTAGNDNTISTSTDNTITYDITPPVGPGDVTTTNFPTDDPSEPLSGAC